jgi:hypothetical protein
VARMSKRYIHISIYVVKTNKHGLCGQNVKDDNIQVAPSKSRSKEKNLQLSTVHGLRSTDKQGEKQEGRGNEDGDKTCVQSRDPPY